MSTEVLDAKIAEVLARKVAARSPKEIETEILEGAARRAQELGAEALFLARLDDQAVARVRRAYVTEAVREPLDDRRAMLIAAAAETMLLDRPTADLAGVERVLRELGPDDVRALADLAKAIEEGAQFRHQYRTADAEQTARGHAGRVHLDASPRREVLVVAGLAFVDTNWQKPHPAFVTERGANVLAVLGSWLAKAMP